MSDIRSVVMVVQWHSLQAMQAIMAVLSNRKSQLTASQQSIFTLETF